MKDALLKFVRQFTDISENELMDVIDKVPMGQFPKGTVLIKQGDVADKIFFILKGCIRKYTVTADGKEATVDFFTEYQTVALFNSYTHRSASGHTLACVEDCIVIIGDEKTEQSFYQINPELKSLNFAILEQSYGQEQDAMAQFKSSTPEDRYKYLLAHRSSLIDRVPQHQLASYLGITPESLSRIKKRLSDAAE